MLSVRIHSQFRFSRRPERPPSPNSVTLHLFEHTGTYECEHLAELRSRQQLRAAVNMDRRCFFVGYYDGDVVFEAQPEC